MPVWPTDTVTVRADEIAEAAVAVAVIEVADALSATLDVLTERVIAGRVSSSVSAKVVPVTVVAVLLPETPMVSPPSTAVSWVGVRVKVPVPLVALAAMVMLKSDTAALVRSGGGRPAAHLHRHRAVPS